MKPYKAIDLNVVQETQKTMDETTASTEAENKKKEETDKAVNEVEVDKI